MTLVKRRSRLGAALIAPLLVAAIGATVAYAQTAPDLTKPTMYYADTAPNISGIWRLAREPGTNVWLVDGKPLVRDSGGAYVGIPYTPKWNAAYAARQKANLTGRIYGEPHFDCLPRGLMHGYVGGNSNIAITQTPGRVQMLFEEQTQIRDIYTDGRQHPARALIGNDEFEPTVNGDSIGHWEGQTLVVDSVAVRPESWRRS